MEVSKDKMESLLMSHSELSSGEGLKWLFTFLPDVNQAWTEMTFEHVLKHLRSIDVYTETIKEERLVVSLFDNGPQLEVSGIANISRYCLNGSPDSVPHKWIRRFVKASESLPDELPVNVISHIIEEKEISVYENDDWKSAAKNYALYKTFSYEDNRDEANQICYNISLIRESPDPSPSMSDSMVSVQPVRYEFEIEFKTHSNIQKLIDTCIVMIQYITQQRFPISKAQQLQILNEYDTLIRKIVEKPKWTTQAQENDKDCKYHFLAPKPVTLEQINIVEPSPESYGMISVLQGYTVTDKADGERYLMYITKNGDVVLINNTFEIFETGLKTDSKQMSNTLIDGEYVLGSQRRDGKPSKAVFAAFDIYFLNGNSIMNLPLMQIQKTEGVSGSTSGSKSTTSKEKKSEITDIKCRYDALKNICNSDVWNRQESSIDLMCKNIIFAEGSVMKETCKQLLNGAHELPYDVDGLIFTPAYLSVYGFYPNKTVPITENVKWDRVFKWKPKEQNTIDFLVKEGNIGIDLMTKKRYKQFKLYTGYNSNQWEPISPFEGMRLRNDKAYATVKFEQRYTYKAKLFTPFSYYEEGVNTAHVFLNENKQPICLDGSIITNDSIVEFAYDPSKKNVPIMNRWIPLRVRVDKTRIFKKNQTLSKTANDLNVAISIWRTIHKPVERDMITGVQNIPTEAISGTLEERLLGIDDVYYARDIPRQFMLSVHMLDFHNQGIKKMLYSRIPENRRDSLLELACGMAGDLPRWRDYGYRFIMGVDISRDNITNPRQGAYARMLKQKQGLKLVVDGVEQIIYPKTVFLIGDCAKKFETGEAAGEDMESKEMFRILYTTEGQERAAPHYMRNYIGIAANGFSLISCMFAVHYFFENEDKLNGFFHNVGYNLKKGGYFILTFMDGIRVNEMFKTSGKAIVEGRKINDTVPVWALIKRYAEFGGSSDSTSDSVSNNYYGKVVDVFLENINKMIPEYLVHFPTLVEKAKDYELEIDSTGMFGETFSEILGGIDKSKSSSELSHVQKAVAALENDPIQTQFSFLNRWVIFKKI
jgi:hypothetical protein